VSKKQFFKVTGFISTLAAGTALVASAATGTGAWFTDSETGSIHADAGSLNLSTSDMAVNFVDLMPGEDREKPITYTATASSGNTDIWLTFDTTSTAYAKFTGEKGNAKHADGGLGRYGHFKVTSDGTPVFDSYNLQNESKDKSGCAGSDGHGFGRMATGASDTPPYCGVPGAILLKSDVAPGAGGRVIITVGLTGRQTQQEQVQIEDLPFKIVATQHNHGPNDDNF
jgi:hypothetical protein